MRNEISTPALVAVAIVVVVLVAGIGWYVLNKDSANAIRTIPPGTSASMPGARPTRGSGERFIMRAPKLNRND